MMRKRRLPRSTQQSTNCSKQICTSTTATHWNQQSTLEVKVSTNKTKKWMTSLMQNIIQPIVKGRLQTPILETLTFVRNYVHSSVNVLYMCSCMCHFFYLYLARLSCEIDIRKIAKRCFVQQYLRELGRIGSLARLCKSYTNGSPELWAISKLYQDGNLCGREKILMHAIDWTRLTYKILYQVHKVHFILHWGCRAMYGLFTW